ncbi:MAG TPA: hypothetical protein VGI39_07595 [Polyangiaceae bacterium]|jgi:hypothetical protein
MTRPNGPLWSPFLPLLPTLALVLAACSSSSGPAQETAAGNDAAPFDASTVDAGPPVEATDSEVTDAGVPIDATADAHDAIEDAGASDSGCPEDGAVPGDLRCTGLYTDWAAKTVAAGVQAYAPAFTLYSDGATKARWISLPAGGQIDTSDMDNWVFPVGTKIWKEFSVGGVRVETRLAWKTDAQWSLLDYRWSADGKTAATRLDNGAANVNGTSYEIPSTTECFTCHAGRSDMVLGFDLIGVGAPGATGLTLAKLVADHLLTNPPPATTVAIPEDTTGKAAAALGYLHVNCGSSCHNGSFAADAYETHLFLKLLAGQMYPDGGGGVVAQLDAYTTAVNVAGTLTPNGTPYLRIAPGDEAHSLLPLMALARTPDAGGLLPMPPIVSHQADTAGMAAVQGWIHAL